MSILDRAIWLITTCWYKFLCLLAFPFPTIIVKNCRYMVDGACECKKNKPHAKKNTNKIKKPVFINGDDVDGNKSKPKSKNKGNRQKPINKKKSQQNKNKEHKNA